jgi:hypothetical protein
MVQIFRSANTTFYTVFSTVIEKVKDNRHIAYFLENKKDANFNNAYNN